MRWSFFQKTQSIEVSMNGKENIRPVIQEKLGIIQYQFP